MRISARGLKIAWGDTARYWKWKPESNSRFPEVAELVTVCWLEIQCSIKARALSPKTTYCAYLIFNITRGSYGLTFPPQESIIKLGSHVSKQNVCLQPDESDPPQPRLTLLGRSASFRVPPRGSGTHGPVKSPCRRDDGWMEVEMGRFFVDEGQEENVDVSMMEVGGGQWKRGLVIQGIELRPTQ
ncbi:F-box protein PP2-B13-like [Asparagus officinalis]|uniref:F-box protein PP2-B13-like n=1 Tax=Asparagus officinalis TaxID=4686 RepID=UPI00098E3EF8|nr:F-box protein PP2-B13-like [Asparagus officinalis]